MFIVHNLSSVYERSDFSVSSETRYRQNSDDFQQGENSIIFQSIHLHLVSNSVRICLSLGQGFIDPQNFKAPPQNLI